MSVLLFLLGPWCIKSRLAPLRPADSIAPLASRWSCEALAWSRIEVQTEIRARVEGFAGGSACV